MASDVNNTGNFLLDFETFQDLSEAYSASRYEQQRHFVIRQLFPKLISKTKHGLDAYKVLAVGSAEGNFDSYLLDEFIKYARDMKNEFKPSKIEWTVVEPNTTALGKFMERAKDLDYAEIDVEIIWVNKTFEDFLQDREQWQTKKKYNLAEFVSCLYYMDEEAVLKETLTNLLEPGGQAFAAVGAEEDIWSQMVQKFGERVPTIVTESHYVTFQTIVKFAEKYGWSHETLVNKVELEITDMWMENSASGQAMLQFFFHTAADPRKTVEGRVIEEFLEFLKVNSYTKTEGNKEKIYINDDAFFTILSNCKS